MKPWRTELIAQSAKNKIGLTDSFLTIGSCFSEAIGNQLLSNKFKVLINPFGVVCNPFSINQLLNFSIKNQLPDEASYLQTKEVHYNYHFHSNLSALNKPDLINKIQSAIDSAQLALRGCNVLIITFGTAFVYRRNGNKHLVGNCHKVAASNFTKQLLTVDEIVNSFGLVIKDIEKINPAIKTILTVSPVRHVKDTLEQNMLSKSILRVACSQIIQKYNSEYFPAYEIMMDDLRDYRFYKSDLIHPTEEAEEYIWEKFTETYFTDPTLKFLSDWGEIRSALKHKPFYPSTQNHQEFLKRTLKKLTLFSSLLDVSKEIELIRSQLI